MNSGPRITMRKVLGGWAARWNDGTEFIDPQRSRAASMAIDDYIQRSVHGGDPIEWAEDLRRFEQVRLQEGDA